MFDVGVNVGVVSLYVRALGDLMNSEQQYAHRRIFDSISNNPNTYHFSQVASI